MTSVGGAQTIAFVHELETRFADNIAYPVPFAISTTETVPNLLGRLKVFDLLQIDFDGTMEETRINPPWLDPDDRTIWDFLLGTEKHILSRWGELDLPEPGPEVARRFLNRSAQILAATVGLMKLGRTYPGALLIRAMFELALQFEYLMQDPTSRARRYQDYTWVTRYKQSTAIANNPTGLVAHRLASSPLRTAGEERNKREYERVRPRFPIEDRRGRQRVARNWYRMSIRNLAGRLGKLGEYRVIYAGCSAWAHGDPFSEETTSHWASNPKILFIVCVGYHARMLLQVADVGGVVLTAEQAEGLKKLAEEFH